MLVGNLFLFFQMSTPAHLPTSLTPNGPPVESSETLARMALNTHANADAGVREKPSSHNLFADLDTSENGQPKGPNLRASRFNARNMIQQKPAAGHQQSSLQHPTPTQQSPASLSATSSSISLPSPSSDSPQDDAPPRVSSSERIHMWSKEGDGSPCDKQFGWSFTRASEFCSSASSSSSSSSSLKCFHHSVTNAVTCASTNIVVDLDKLHVSQGGEPIQSVRGRVEKEEFVRYSPGAFGLNCERPSNIQVTETNYPHHLKDMFMNIAFKGSSAAIGSTAISDASPFWAPPRSTSNTVCDVIIHAPALFVTRYEYANLYHSMGDFYNTFQTQWMFGLRDDMTAGQENETLPPMVVFFDGHSAGALDEVWDRMFSGRVTYINHLPETYRRSANDAAASASTTTPPRRFCFKRAYFVSPAYKSALSVEMMKPIVASCKNSAHLHDFSNELLRKYGVDTLNPWAPVDSNTPGSAAAAAGQPLFSPSVKDLFGKELLPRHLDLNKTPLISFIFRKDYLAHPRLKALTASRKIANEMEIGREIMLNPNVIDATYGGVQPYMIGVDLASLSMLQQLVLIRYSTLLIGIHGAGLSHTLFLRPGGSLLELVPPEVGGRAHFRYFAEWAGHRYLKASVAGERLGAPASGHHVDVKMLKRVIREAVVGGSIVEPTPGWKKYHQTPNVAAGR